MDGHDRVRRHVELVGQLVERGALAPAALAAVDRDQQARLRGLQRVVDVDDIGRRLEYAAHEARRGQALFRGRPVNLGHQGRDHRRTGRHLDHFDVRVVTRADRLQLLADMCRANTLATVKRAGSGHLGSSLSSLDIVTQLYFDEMNLVQVGIDHPDRDIYFSSKGHDVPGHYAVLYALGIIPRERFINLRRLGGTHGHPDLNVPGMEANTGSLGMGISKAKGMAWAKDFKGHAGRVFVMTGDGELQEGQIWESLQATAHQQINNVSVIVDGNKFQSDKFLDEIVSLGDLEAKFKAFGWYVESSSDQTRHPH